MGTRTFGAIVMLVLGGCASYNAPLADRSQPVEKAKVETRFTPGSAEGGIPLGTRYQVQAGDTLYGIAFRFELNPEGLAAANRIAPFATLKTGQTLVLSEAKPPTNPIKAATPKPATKSVTSKPVAVTPGSWQWQWPVDGRVLGGFSTQQRFSRSVRLKGELGDPVRAAAPGRVVYAGDGLVGLGNLVLIRHDDTWLSAYGHNQSIQVQVNQMVQGGQEIARLGATGTDAPKLHFEIRRNGEPVNPVDVLPSR